MTGLPPDPAPPPDPPQSSFPALGPDPPPPPPFAVNLRGVGEFAPKRLSLPGSPESPLYGADLDGLQELLVG